MEKDHDLKLEEVISFREIDGGRIHQAKIDRINSDGYFFAERW